MAKTGDPRTDLSGVIPRGWSPVGADLRAALGAGSFLPGVCMLLRYKWFGPYKNH